MTIDAAAMHRVLLASRSRRRDSEIIERDDWLQIRTPSSSQSRHNKVLRAVFEDESVDRVIDEVLVEHEARGAKLSWVVDLASQPELGLSCRLAAAGLPVMGLGLGMARSTSDADGTPPDGLRVTLATMGDADIYAEVMVRGWPQPEARRHILRDGVIEACDRRDGIISHWVAWHGDEPIGAARLYGLGDLGYMQGACVLPQYRGRGVYTALMHARLRVCARYGIPTGVVWANPDTSAPVARGMGFEEVAGASVVFHDAEAV